MKVQGVLVVTLAGHEQGYWHYTVKFLTKFSLCDGKVAVGKVLLVEVGILAIQSCILIF